MIDFAAELNSEQLAVVQNGDGPCLVLAGAGSGKTRTITYRVAYLLEKGVKPEHILLVTFTNKAAEEMKERVKKLVGAEHGVLPWSGTFHHIGYRILRQYSPLLGYRERFTVLDSDDSQSLIKLCSKETAATAVGKRFPSANVISSIISYARNAELPIRTVIEDRFYQHTPHTEAIEHIATEYAERKKAASAMDFDDLLANWLLLLNNDTIRAKFAAQFQYILVDEYQDTNKIQASIIKRLASVHNNIVVVGDDAQSIYSFRAADIQNILRFEKEYPGAHIFKLETNYRSTEEILRLANNVIANNVAQYRKELRTLTSSDVKPQLFPLVDQMGEATFVADSIEKHLQEGVAPTEIAVLFRAAHHSQMLEVELVRRGISYDYRGGIRFFERAHIKDILAYLRIMNNVADTAAWLRVLVHEEGIGPAAAQKIIDAVRVAPTLEGVAEVGGSVLGGKAQVGWNNFVSIWRSIISEPVHSPAPLIKAVVGSAYRQFIEAEYVDAKDRLQDIKQLAAFAERYESLEDFLAEMTLQESFRTLNEEGSEEKGRIVLSTIHQAKGLEWTTVFIINLSSGGFPSERALREDNGLEEERRLLYVAITRARRFLYLTYPMTGGSYGDFVSGPSIFLGEINLELLEDHSLLSTTALNDSEADVEYIPEDGLPKIRPGSFLRDINDL